MTPEDFEAMLDRLGARLDQWPESERDRAALLLRESDAARRSYEAARQLDNLLDEALPEIDPVGLRSRILAGIEAAPPLPWFDWLTQALWRPAAFALIPLVLGFTLGVTTIEIDSDLEDSVTFLAFSDFDELAELGDGTDAEAAESP